MAATTGVSQGQGKLLAITDASALATHLDRAEGQMNGFIGGKATLNLEGCKQYFPSIRVAKLALIAIARLRMNTLREYSGYPVKTLPKEVRDRLELIKGYVESLMEKNKDLSDTYIILENWMGSIPAEKWQPTLKAVTPFILMKKSNQSAMICFEGHFKCQEPQFSLLANGTIYKPDKISTSRIEFSVPITASEKTVDHQKVTFAVPYDTGTIISHVRPFEYQVWLTVLPLTFATLKWKESQSKEKESTLTWADPITIEFTREKELESLSFTTFDGLEHTISKNASEESKRFEGNPYISVTRHKDKDHYEVKVKITNQSDIEMYFFKY